MDSGRNILILSISDALRAGRFRVWTPVGVRNFLFSLPVRPTQPPVQVVQVPFPGGKAAESWLCHPFSSSTEVIMGRAILLLLVCSTDGMLWGDPFLYKHRHCVYLQTS